MNILIASGYLTTEPEEGMSSRGAITSSFMLGIPEYGSNITYIKVVCFNKVAEACNKHLKSKSKVLVNGRLSVKKIKTESGLWSVWVSLIADKVEFLPYGKGLPDEERRDSELNSIDEFLQPGVDETLPY